MHLNLEFWQNSSNSQIFANDFEFEINKKNDIYIRFQKLIQDSSCIFLTLVNKKKLHKSQINDLCAFEVQIFLTLDIQPYVNKFSRTIFLFRYNLKTKNLRDTWNCYQMFIFYTWLHFQNIP